MNFEKKQDRAFFFHQNTLLDEKEFRLRGRSLADDVVLCGEMEEKIGVMIRHFVEI